jgi:hypothetical protein
MTSSKISCGRSDTESGFSLIYSVFFSWLSSHHCSTLIYHHPTRWVIALSKQHIFMPSVKIRDFILGWSLRNSNQIWINFFIPSPNKLHSTGGLLYYRCWNFTLCYQNASWSPRKYESEMKLRVSPEVVMKCWSLTPITYLMQYEYRAKEKWWVTQKKFQHKMYIDCSGVWLPELQHGRWESATWNDTKLGKGKTWTQQMLMQEEKIKRELI